MDKQRVVIGPNNITFHRFNDEGELEALAVDHDELYLLAWEWLELEKGVTLKRLFDIIADFSEGWEVLLREPVRAYIEEVNSPPKEMWESKGIQCLEIQWDAEIDVEEKEIFFECSLSGEGEAQIEDEELDIEIGDPVSYGVELIPTNNLRDLPVVLNTEVRLFLLRSTDDAVKVSKGRYLGERHFTVLEVFKSIMGTVAAFGTPEEREERVKELREQVSEELPWDDIEQRLLSDESEKKSRRRHKKFIDPLGLFGGADGESNSKDDRYV